ncbi:DUF5714 domain-containing protein [Zhaonella formicivorans]|jgi:hypothetical protein|uniref:DUF5714 domain-containing protein n=1 Tax=Zhaonella formicivorans TaxID=2528593 RepID=UPI0010D34655|nr:DUF5714 domain-containing protein [Zhaonella formicivorans]
MNNTEGCLICGEELVYGSAWRLNTCLYCGRTQHSTIYCPNGHFICDNCHRQEAIEVLKRVCLDSNSKDPVALANKLMAHPSFKMHGPEHHALVPAVLVTAYGNITGETGESHILEAIARGATIPGGMCGNFGACGAGIGAGVAMSVIAGATPLSTGSWGEANLMTAHVLKSIGEKGGPRCCKRCTWTALTAAMNFLEEKRGVHFDKTATEGNCTHFQRNKQCQRSKCVFFPPARQKS